MWARHRLELFTAVLAAALGVVYLLLPPMGSDLAAQQARAGFFAAHGYTPMDLRWYAGVDQLGYSLTSQPVMALLGVRVTGALSLLVAAVLFALLLRRTEAPRPLLGAIIGTLCIAGNLVSGRVTYGLGVCLGLAALLALTSPRRRWLPPVPALLAAATSPVAALFLGLAGVALALSGRVRAGLLIAVPAALPLVLNALLFGDGGWMNISRSDTVRAVVAALVVAVLVPRRPVRIGGVLAALGVLAAALIHTPVGLNATRLAVMFTLPLLAAYATLPRLARAKTTPARAGLPRLARAKATPARAGLPRLARAGATPVWAVALLLVVACWWQPPVVTGDVRDIGNPTADPAYFRPLLDRLARERLTGRVEIPATRAYWEAAHMGDVPLARGWLRQADIDRNPLFFTEIPGATGTGVPLTAGTYRLWLEELAVQFVAVPDAELTWSGRPEAALIDAGLPYLTEIWASPHWRLYAVTDPRPIVAAPATLTSQDAAALTFESTAAGDFPVRVRWNRWLTVSGGATLHRDGDWLLVRVPAAGRYTISS
ncbi:hypothetical protein Aab01nite_38980 [Paractinoplanes abujensis]|uniref:Uncharacterized protein n=1 Tax=Paractinoplanes abujensis TaxID=882441 RepID=A0A7W7G1S3_9ACTN|nr:hypothetical protein [Actinoplanes abujensis]MBB4694478.1 hypothetical protein [Actinoplanes abujensis]GID20308.1 hypothetical protein Aab01nite_38980 [Actinoplanes abujensis]